MATYYWSCSHCKTNNPPHMTTCKTCGRMQADTQSSNRPNWLCPHCRTNNPPHLTICKSCGRMQADADSWSAFTSGPNRQEDGKANWVENGILYSGRPTGSYTSSTSYGSARYGNTWRNPKSTGKAIFLEFLLPGTGLMYVKRWGRGILLLVISLIGVIFYNGMLQSACPGTYQNGMCMYYTNIFVAGQAQQQLQQMYTQINTFALILALVWLALRIILVVNQVKKYNEENA